MPDTLLTAVAPAPRVAPADPVDAMPGAVRAHALLCLEALSKLARRPLPSVRHAARFDPRAEGRRFGLHKGSTSSILMPMIVLSTLVDVPLGNLMLHAFAVPHALALHALLLTLTLWTLLWGLGLRSAVRHVDHVLQPDALVLRIGFSAVCRIPLEALRDVHLLPSREAGWRQKRGLTRQSLAELTPLDEPTLLIELSDAHAARSGCRIVRSGRDRPVPPWVAVYVDQPAALREALLSARATKSTG
jgi:hypothetical protein